MSLAFALRSETDQSQRTVCNYQFCQLFKPNGNTERKTRNEMKKMCAQKTEKIGMQSRHAQANAIIKSEHFRQSGKHMCVSRHYWAKYSGLFFGKILYIENHIFWLSVKNTSEF